MNDSRDDFIATVQRSVIGDDTTNVGSMRMLMLTKTLASKK